MAAVKICGLTRTDDVATAVAAGAAAVGCIVFEGSKRAVRPTALPELLAPARGLADRVAVVVDPDDDLIAELRRSNALDLIQLHGNEPPARVGAVREASGLGIIKAWPIANAADVTDALRYTNVADRLLFDAKPVAGSAPGGNGVTFDWQLLAEADLPEGWGLAGGLTPATVGAAVTATGAAWVDVASGVERAPGLKDHSAIRAFCAAAAGNAVEGWP